MNEMTSGNSGSAVSVDGGGGFFGGSSGKWAGEQFLKALKSGTQISPALLRTADTLRKDEWIELDKNLVEAAVIRLRAIADLRAAGLTKKLKGGLGKTVFQWEKVNDMNPAQVTMDGRARTEDDRVEFSLAGLPLPIIHKDFNINLRTLLASRQSGEGLDQMQTRLAGRLMAEKLESMLFNGGPTFAGLPIYGLTNHPDVNLVPFGTNGNWSQSAKTGDNILADILSAITVLEADRMYGPYGIYVGSGVSTKLEEDFKTYSDKTIRQRMLEIDRIQFIRVADQMPAGKVLVVQMTSDVVVLVEGERMQTVQWDIEGGFQLCFKGFMMTVPLVRSDVDGHCGVALIRTP